MNGLRSFSFHLTRLSFVEALREKTFDCYLPGASGPGSGPKSSGPGGGLGLGGWVVF